MTDTVHRISYGWSEGSLLGTRGMGPVTATLPPDDVAFWDSHLRHHVSTTGQRTGFVHFTVDGVGVLVRKTPPTGSDAREGIAAGALLGPGLDGRTALGLTEWRGWDDPFTDRPLRLAALAEPVARGLRSLRERARGLDPDGTARLIAQLLVRPREAFTVVGQKDPLAFVYLLGEFFNGAPSFASHEQDDTRAQLPDAVFLAKAPEFSLVTGARRRLPDRAEALDPLLFRFALAMVKAYRAHGPRGVENVRASSLPADLKSAKEWATAAQYLPGVLADIALLPSVPPELVEGLTGKRVLARITEDARRTPDSDLLAALSVRTPEAVWTRLMEEALTRVFTDLGGTILLDGLAEVVRPVPAEFLPSPADVEFGRLVAVAGKLCGPEDRRRVLEGALRKANLGQLIGWIDENAQADPENAGTVFSVLCGRARKAGRADLAELVRRKGLGAAARRMTGADTEAADWLGSLYAALPSRLIGRRETLEALGATRDPIVLHALEAAVPDGRLADVHRLVRRVYFAEHGLAEPVRSPRRTGRGGSRKRRMFRSQPPDDPRKTQ